MACFPAGSFLSVADWSIDVGVRSVDVDDFVLAPMTVYEQFHGDVYRIRSTLLVSDEPTSAGCWSCYLASIQPITVDGLTATSYELVTCLFSAAA